MTTKTIEMEVAKATGEKRGKKEPQDTWFARLARAAGKNLKDDEWNALSEPAQKWVNAANEALNAKGEMPFPSDATREDAAKTEDADDDEEADDEADKDADEENDGDDESEDEPADEDDAKSAKGKARAAKKAAKGKAPKAKPAKAEKPAKKGRTKPADDDEEEPAEKPARKSSGGGSRADRGVGEKLRRVIIQNHKADLDAVYEKITSKGVKMAKATAAAAYYTTHATLRTLADLEYFDIATFKKK